MEDAPTRMDGADEAGDITDNPEESLASHETRKVVCVPWVETQPSPR
ncbi:hypothetical protein [Nocardioides sp.]|nr:hypothetical protein [Nocardioides sp.]